ELIHSYRMKGESHMPPNIHHSLTGSARDPFPVSNVTQDEHWRLLGKEEKKAKNNVASDVFPQVDRSYYVSAQGTTTLDQTSTATGHKKDKRKRDADNDSPATQRKRVHFPSNDQQLPFKEFPWDDTNHSCAYDSLLSVLYSVYQQATIS
ncbi:hypothetical protein C8Q80DRAFT_1107424, partial [Daedaleopsis nitida]